MTTCCTRAVQVLTLQLGHTRPLSELPGLLGVANAAAIVNAFRRVSPLYYIVSSEAPKRVKFLEEQKNEKKKRTTLMLRRMAAY